MRNNIKWVRIISVLLTAVMLAPLFTGEALAAEDPFALFRENAVGIGLKDADPAAFPGYVHYDPKAFYADLEELQNLAAGNGQADLDQAFALYDSLYRETVSVRDLYYAALLGSGEDVYHTAFQNEKEYTGALLTEMKDRFLNVMREICSGVNGEIFRQHIGSDMIFNSYTSYAPLTEKAKALLDREEALESEYNALNAVLYEEAADDGNFDYASANERMGRVFLDLVAVRKQIAREMGYENYAEYADRELFYRDYSEADMQLLKNAVKKYGEMINYYTLRVFLDATMPEMDTELILGDSGNVVSSFSDAAADSYRLLRDRRLLSAGFEECRVDSEVTHIFPGKNSAAIEVKFYQNTEFYNYKTFIHELGHFSHMIRVANPNPLFTEEGCTDVVEMHSTFLETLASKKMDAIYKRPMFFQGYELCSLAYSLLSGCYYDDWQRAIYESEKELTPDGINALFKEICMDYGIAEYEGMEYEWMWVPHNFLYPLYYFSYAASGFAALQLWNEAGNDFAHAVQIWEKSLWEDPYREGYMQALENLGFESFTCPGCAEETLEKVIGDLMDLEAAAMASLEGPAA